MALENIQDLINKYQAGTSPAASPMPQPAAASGNNFADAINKLFGPAKKSPSQPSAMDNNQANVPMAQGGFNQQVPTQDRSAILQAMINRSRMSNPGRGGQNGS